MNYATIKYNDIANGEGIRTTLFVQGCHIICPWLGCQNYEIQTYKGGMEFGIDQMYEIFNSMHKGIAGLSILGGEPLSKPNIDTVTDIMKLFKEKFPDKTIWVWTGFQLDLSLEGKATHKGGAFKDKPTFFRRDTLELIDVLVDGRWEQENYDPTLLWAGSTNQRVIDVQKTLENKEITLYSDNRTK